MKATAVPYSTQQARTIPFIKGNFFLGNLPAFVNNRQGLLQRMAAQSDVIGMHIGRFPVILFNRPEHVQSILVEHAYDFTKGAYLHNIFRPVIGDGIFTSEGDLHRRQRKLMAPSFQPRHIASYTEAIGFYGDQLQRSWEEDAVINIDQQMIGLTMSIIGKALFGADVFTGTDQLGAAMTVFSEYVATALSRLFPIPYTIPVRTHRRTYKAIAFVRHRLQRLIDERRSHPGERNDLLSRLLEVRDEDGQPMEDEQVMAECLLLFSAGHESIAAALTWSWYLLCLHPEIYTRLHQEVDGVLQGRMPTYMDLARLPFCLQVLKESMRLYPPAFAVGRKPLQDREIGGYQVSKNSLILISPFTMHRRPDFYPEPERFDPGRFAPQHEKMLPRHAFMPFGAGPRVCIGNHFALMEGQLLLALLAQRVHFSLEPGQHIVADLKRHMILRPDKAINVRVHHR